MSPPRGAPPGAKFFPRPQCWRCRKARATCVCGLLPLVTNRTEVIVLQHYQERRHALGSVRLLKLGLAKVRVEVAFQDSLPPLSLPPGVGLLFPGPQTRDLVSLAPYERPTALLLLDGTWPQTRRLFRLNPWLQALPRFRLNPRTPSRYRLRPEPSPHHISSLEAAVQALLALEPEALRPPPCPPLESWFNQTT